MKHSCQCPFCEGDALSTREEQRELKTKYGVGTYLALVSACAACGEEFVTPEQADITDQRVAELRRQLKTSERTLSGDMIRQIRESLGWSQREAAEIFGGGEVAFARYEAESVSMSRPAELLLKMMYVWPETIHRARTIRASPLSELIPMREDVETTNRVADAAANGISPSSIPNKISGLLLKVADLVPSDRVAWASSAFEITLHDISAHNENFPDAKINHGGYTNNRSGATKHSFAPKYSDRRRASVQCSR